MHVNMIQSVQTVQYGIKQLREQNIKLKCEYSHPSCHMTCDYKLIAAIERL